VVAEVQGSLFDQDLSIIIHRYYLVDLKKRGRETKAGVLKELELVYIYIDTLPRWLIGTRVY